MRKFELRFIATLCLVLVATSHLSAEKGGYHIGSLYVAASGGYSTILGKTANMEVPGLGCGSVEFGIDGYLRHFIYNVGLNVGVFSSSCRTDITIPDAADDHYTVHYDMLSPLSERQVRGNVGLRMMVGYSANKFLKREAGGVYFLAGFNTIATLGEDNSVKLNYKATTTTGGQVTDIKEYKASGYSTLGMYGNITVCGEVGYELNLKNFNRLRVGAFVEYGLWNSTYTKEPTSCQPNPDNLNEIVLNSYYLSPEMHSVYTPPLMAGVKIAFIFKIGKSSPI